jgi:two-component system OmpR family response regulator/two-component system response regulator CpxR
MIRLGNFAGNQEMAAVLLVDDDVELAEMLGDYLAQDGFVVTTLHDGVSGVEAALSGQFAIAVLDVMMPGLSGIEVLRRIRATSALPVIMLTARGDDMDRIVGLELGADDYVPKPCQPRELAARLRAILRRTALSAEPGNAPIVVGELCLRPEQRLAEWAGATVDLTSTEFNLLEVLARNAGRPVSKSELSVQALGRELVRFDRSVDVHLSSIRHKLGTLPDGRSCIQTVYRQGYQLIRA